MMESKILDASVVIPCKDDWRIFRCIESIDEDVEVIVVLNGTPDPLREKLAQTNVKLCLIPEPNLGKALDIGILTASKERVILTDSDCVFEKGCIRQLYDGLNITGVAKGRVIFRYTGWLSHIISQSRDHLTSDETTAYKPLLALRKSILSSIGSYYFHHEIHWREDAEFDFRIKQAGIKLNVCKNAIVYHDPLTPFQDLRSAFRYGTGWSNSKRLGLTLSEPPSSVESTMQNKGFLPALYMSIYRMVYYCGYFVDRIFNIYKVAENNTNPVIDAIH
jgi:glycosyltransferase involved in cell wall biosynthesis